MPQSPHPLQPLSKKDGLVLLKEAIQQAPNTPGVYRMLGEGDKVLYVGKAKYLKKRLTSYTHVDRLPNRLRRMVFETRRVVWVEARSEVEALLLEISLIKSLKPRYNVLLTDDTSYPFIVITQEETPRLMHMRGKLREPGQQFGPYPSADSMYATMELMEKIFRLRTCSPAVFRNRSRPCLKYYISRCSGPCVRRIGPQEYQDAVRQASLFLKGKPTEVRKEIAARMEAASAALNFEQAARERDKLRAIAEVLSTQTAFGVAGLGDADVLALVRKGARIAVQIFMYRDGQHVGNHLYFFDVGKEDGSESSGVTEEEMMGHFLAQHYGTEQGAALLPKRLLCSVLPAEQSLLTEAFSQTAGHKVSIETPQRGDIKKVLDQALHNAQAALERRMAETANWASQWQAFADLLHKSADIPATAPFTRVDAFDISNISGKQAVGSMVVAGPEGMEKKNYRKFTIQTEGPDDYAMMAEMLSRRYRNGEQTENLPNVILVDGGIGHLNTLVKVAAQVGLMPAVQEHRIFLCAIAKGLERNKGLETIFVWHPNLAAPSTTSHGAPPPFGVMPAPHRSAGQAPDGTHNKNAVQPPHVQERGTRAEGAIQTLPIAHNTPLIFMLQNIRDESHRTAIGFHRQKRSKAATRSTLQDIPGVGAARRKALIQAFGSAAAVRSASVEDIAKVEGISRALAERIWTALKG